jgi:alkylation response protein AidB-like acyl-CoA dehydrogenase
MLWKHQPGWPLPDHPILYKTRGCSGRNGLVVDARLTAAIGTAGPHRRSEGMDFRFTPEQVAFRERSEAFLKEILPPDWDGAWRLSDEGRHQLQRQVARQSAERGRLTMAWPQEWGGLGAGFIEQAIWKEVAFEFDVPIYNQGVERIGPAVMVYGTDEQKQRFLPPIRAGAVTWCQGFSEPGAGSDLAALETRAVPDGDEFAVDGQKIWTSLAHHADWMMLLVRSDADRPKHRGISCLLVDMKSPGITVRPLANLSGERGFNQVFFDNLRVPRENLLGGLHDGWRVTTTTLDFERSGIDRLTGAQRPLQELVAHVRAHGGPDGEMHRTLLADLTVQYNVGRWLCYRVSWMQSRGRRPNYEASISKLYGSELQQRVAQAAVRILGMAGLLDMETAPYAGRLARYYLGSVAATVAAGTSEVQRNIIATRGLGLPRD